MSPSAADSAAAASGTFARLVRCRVRVGTGGTDAGLGAARRLCRAGLKSEVSPGLALDLVRGPMAAAGAGCGAWRAMELTKVYRSGIMLFVGAF